MPAMSSFEQAWCRSLPWRTFTRRLVFPWAVGPTELRGDVLELGSGSGAMAVELLERYPAIQLTATDVDPAMREAASQGLARFGNRVEVRDADATALPFADSSFDAVVSFIMLHHVIDWEGALSEVARVLRPGGTLAGYDLMLTGPNRLLHRMERSPHRMATADELRNRLDELPFADITVRPGLAGTVARFRAHRTDAPIATSEHRNRDKERPMTAATYDVKGMTCGHCVNSVSTEIAKLPGVTDVAVDLDTGKVTVTSDAPLDTTAVRAAVDEAGYELMT